MRSPLPPLVAAASSALLLVVAAPHLAAAEAQDQEAQAAELAGILAERRGLELEGPPKVEMLSPETFRAALRSQHIELKTETYFGTTRSVFRLLGILPHDFSEDLLELTVDASQSAYFGIYSPTRGAILIPEIIDGPIANMANAEAFRREVLAHELQHAAQDCRWPITSLIGSSAPNHDARMARSALLEGDAVCTAMDVMLSESGSSVFDFKGDIAKGIRDQLELGSVLDAAHSGVLSDPTSRVFEYGDGSALVQTILQAKGWEGVNAALDDPPASTEQVLHPTKYLDQRDWPVTPALELTADLAAAGWKLGASDSLGELMLRELMDPTLEDAALVRASFGWDGDQWLLLRRGEEEALLWTSVWDSRTDARQAFDALAGVYALSGPTRESWRSSADGPAGPVLLRRKANRVAMSIGLDFGAVDSETMDKETPPGGAAWPAVEHALSCALQYHDADKKKGRGEGSVTRRLERAAVDALDAALVEVDGLTVRIRDLDLELTLPSSSWTVKTDTPMASVRVMLLRGNPQTNMNVNVAPSDGMDAAASLEATLAYLDANFQNMEVEEQSTREGPKGPTFEIRYAMDIGANRCWFWQIGVDRGDLLVVLTCTSVGSPIEGDVAKEFESLMGSATFGGGDK